jgi:hypothetical protein
VATLSKAKRPVLLTVNDMMGWSSCRLRNFKELVKFKFGK